MDGSFDLALFIVVSLVFFVIPYFIIIGILNLAISRRMAKKGLIKSKYYWPKLIGVSVLLLVLGLFIYDVYYKINANF